MENRISYILIGVFVFALFGFGIGFVLWLGKYSESQSFDYFKVITKESVSGLNVKAPVKLKGVSVGEVRDIYIDEENSEDVVVLIRVKEGTPVKEDTYATLVPQGITGLNFVELQGGSNNAPSLVSGKKANEYAVIKSQSSMFTRLDNTLEMIGSKTENVLDKTDRVMSDKNLKNIEIILQNLAITTQKLNDTIEGFSKDTKEIKTVLQEAMSVEKSMVEASNKVGVMSDIIAQAVNETGIETMESMRAAAATVSTVMGRLEERVNQGTFDVDVLLKENLLPLKSAMEEFRLMMIQARGTLQKFSDSPSDIIYKQTQIKPAPSEENR